MNHIISNVIILDNTMENRKITVGRDKKCDLAVEDIPQNGRVSGRHATITEVVSEGTSGRVFILEDHSTNGTFVNSNFVHNGTCKIKEGDSITLGRDYVLEWTQILPFFGGGRKTDRKPFEKATVINASSGERPTFVSADPVYPDPLPIVDGGTVSPTEQDDEKGDSTEKELVFTGKHWLIAIGAFIFGLIIGLLI